MNKKEARIYFKKLRHEIINKDDYNHIIYDRVMKLINEDNIKRIAIYNSFNDEVETGKIIETLLDSNLMVYLPKIENDSLNFYRITKDTEYVKNRFGIFEPNNSEIINPEALEIILVPGLAFNEQNKRLGYGGGYYDKYLPMCKKALKVGLFYKEQFDKNGVIEFNEFDYPLDRIITN